jgi:ribosomal-protein-alanine N-acetyltransferase
MSEPMLQTERLVFRPFRETDLDDLAALFADPEVMRYLSRGVPLTRAETAERLERALRHWSQHGFGIWALFERGAFVGRCGVAYLHFADQPELAYTLARRCWGKGLATEAAARALRYAFEEVGLPRVVAFARVENGASRRVLEKVGMTFRGPYEYEGHEAVAYEMVNPQRCPGER